MSEQENPLRAEKRKKLGQLRQAGIDPYPHQFKRSTTVTPIRQRFEGKLGPGEKSEQDQVRLAGRLMTMRNMGKASFFNIQDEGATIQVYIRLEELNEQAKKSFDLVDLGDIVGIEGFVFRTQKGELSIHARNFVILTKTLEPLPEKYHGVTDIEIKYRHRHLDLMSDADSRQVFLTRSKIIRLIRDHMHNEGFIEVETPVLQPIYGGAAAHPFSTHHRAQDMKLYLKISPELYLKRLLVGGFEKVFEIGKNFRNEGIDRTHNPEFTMMEWYEAYTDYFDQMNRFENLIAFLAKEITGSTKIQYQGIEIDLTPPWRRLTVAEGVKEQTGIDFDKTTSDELFAACKKNGSDLEKPSSMGEMLMELFELTVEKNLVQPTFVMNHPVEISPLTKHHRSDKRFVERFEPFIAGMEVGNSYTELNDPEEQLARLKEQEAKRVVDDEAHPMDEDFLAAIDAGMPPTGGTGIGIERIVMLLTNQASIRDILFFPLLKKSKEQK